MDPLQPTSAELDSLLRRVRVAVAEQRVRITEYARKGAAALDWNELILPSSYYSLQLLIGSAANRAPIPTGPP